MVDGENIGNEAVEALPGEKLEKLYPFYTDIVEAIRKQYEDLPQEEIEAKYKTPQTRNNPFYLTDYDPYKIPTIEVSDEEIASMAYFLLPTQAGGAKTLETSSTYDQHSFEQGWEYRLPYGINPEYVKNDAARDIRTKSLFNVPPTLLDERIEDFYVQKTDDRLSIATQGEEVDKSNIKINKEHQIVSEIYNQIEPLVKSITEIYEKLTKDKKRIDILSNLPDKQNVLIEQYNTDIAGLNSMIEQHAVLNKKYESLRKTYDKNVIAHNEEVGKWEETIDRYIDAENIATPKIEVELTGIYSTEKKPYLLGGTMRGRSLKTLYPDMSPDQKKAQKSILASSARGNYEQAWDTLEKYFGQYAKDIRYSDEFWGEYIASWGQEAQRQGLDPLSYVQEQLKKYHPEGFSSIKTFGLHTAANLASMITKYFPYETSEVEQILSGSIPARIGEGAAAFGKIMLVSKFLAPLEISTALTSFTRPLLPAVTASKTVKKVTEFSLAAFSRGISGLTTFGTYAALEGTPDLLHDRISREQFAKDVVHSALFGFVLGPGDVIPKMAVGVPLNATIAYLSAKLEGADNKEAFVSSLVMAAYATLGRLKLRPLIKKGEKGYVEGEKRYKIEDWEGGGFSKTPLGTRMPLEEYREQVRKEFRTETQEAIKNSGFSPKEKKVLSTLVDLKLKKYINDGNPSLSKFKETHAQITEGIKEYFKPQLHTKKGVIPYTEARGGRPTEPIEVPEDKLPALKKGEQIIKPLKKGEDISRKVIKMGSDQGGISKFLGDQIAKEDYGTETVAIKDLIKNDPELQEYLDKTKGEVRKFEDTGTYVEPIVTSKGEVLDGYNRIAQAIKDGETTIEILKGEPKPLVSKQKVKEIADKNPGGFSIDHAGNKITTKKGIPKFVVSVTNGITYKGQSLDEVYDIMSRDERLGTGGWVSPTVGTEIDAGFVVDNLSDAEALAKRYAQEYIFEVGKSDLIPIKYTAAEKKALPGKPDFSKPLDLSLSSQKTGQQNVEFFTEKAKKPSSKIPYKPVIKVDKKTPVAKSYLEFTQGGNFTGHISKMIPGFAEKQQMVAEAIVKSDATSFLDVGTSEGGLVKTVADNNKNIKSVGVDPNPAMLKNYKSTRDVSNAEYQLKAIGASWTEPDGTVIKEFKPKQKFDIINEDFTFQFISNDRPGQIKQIKSMLKDDGLFITSEKFHTENFEANEQKKLEHQKKYFDKRELTEDAEGIVTGMSKDMVKLEDYRNLLEKNFKYVKEFWDAGNFKGFVASNNQAKVEKFLKDVGDLTTEFSEAPEVKHALKRREIPKTEIKSAVETAVEETFPKNMKATSVVNWLKKQPGIKKAEIEVLGIEDYVKGRDVINQESLLAHIRETDFKITEVILSEDIKDLTDNEYKKGLTVYAAEKNELESLVDPERRYYSQGVSERLDKIEEIEAFHNVKSVLSAGKLLIPPAQNVNLIELEFRGKGPRSGVYSLVDAFVVTHKSLLKDEDYLAHTIYIKDHADLSIRQVGGAIEDFQTAMLKAERSANELLKDKVDAMITQSSLEYKEYSEEGGHNHREIIFELSGKFAREVQNRRHFPGTSDRKLAWIRVNDFIVPRSPSDKVGQGNRVFHLDESQADVHQLGKAGVGYQLSELPEGSEIIDTGASQYYRWYYKGPDGVKIRIRHAFSSDSKQKVAVKALTMLNRKRLPNYPMKGEEWWKFSLRRMLAIAVQEGYSGISLTSGLRQIERYENDLRMRVDKIEWDLDAEWSDLPLFTRERLLKDYPSLKLKVPHLFQLKGMGHPQKLSDLYARKDIEMKDLWVRVTGFKDGNRKVTHLIPLNGKTKIGDHFDHVSLDNMLGRPMSSKIRKDINSNLYNGDFTGDQLTIGGLGMKKHYDDRIGNFLKKYLKKWGMTIELNQVWNRGKLGKTPFRMTFFTKKFIDDFKEKGLPKWSLQEPKVTEKIKEASGNYSTGNQIEASSEVAIDPLRNKMLNIIRKVKEQWPKGTSPKLIEVVKHLEKNPFFNGVKISVERAKDLILSAKQLKGIGYPHEVNPANLLKKGEKGYVAGKQLYRLKEEGLSQSNPDGTGQIILRRGLLSPAVGLEEICHQCRGVIDRTDPDLGKRIDNWEKEVIADAKKRGIKDLPGRGELFEQAFVFNVMGYAKENPHIAKHVWIPNELVNRFSGYVGAQTDGPNVINKMTGNVFPKFDPKTAIGVEKDFKPGMLGNEPIPENTGAVFDGEVAGAYGGISGAKLISKRTVMFEGKEMVQVTVEVPRSMRSSERETIMYYEGDIPSNFNGVAFIGGDCIGVGMTGERAVKGIEYGEVYHAWAFSENGAAFLEKLANAGFDTVAIVAYNDPLKPLRVNPIFQELCRKAILMANGEAGNKVRTPKTKEVYNRALKDIKPHEEALKTAIKNADKDKIKKERYWIKQNHPWVKAAGLQKGVALTSLAKVASVEGAESLYGNIVGVGKFKEIRRGDDRLYPHEVYPIEVLFSLFKKLDTPISFNDVVSKSKLPEKYKGNTAWMMMNQYNFFMNRSESPEVELLMRALGLSKDLAKKAPPKKPPTVKHALRRIPTKKASKKEIQETKTKELEYPFNISNDFEGLTRRIRRELSEKNKETVAKMDESLGTRDGLAAVLDWIPRRIRKARRAIKNSFRSVIMTRRGFIGKEVLFMNHTIENIKQRTTLLERELLSFIIEKAHLPESIKQTKGLLNGIGRSDLADLLSDKKVVKRLENLVKKGGAYEKQMTHVWDMMVKSNKDLSDKQIEDYVTHIWDLEPNRVSEVSGWFQTMNPFEKKRYIPTLSAGIIELGLKPKILDIAEILRIHNGIAIKTIANRKFLDDIKRLEEPTGMKLLLPSDLAPSNWIEIKHPILRHPITKEYARAHPEIAKSIDVILGSPRKSEIGAVALLGNAYDIINGWQRMIQLRMSLFHNATLFETALCTNVGFLRALKIVNPYSYIKDGLIKERSLVLDEMMDMAPEAAKYGVQLGKTQDYPAAGIQKALDGLVEKFGDLPKWSPYKLPRLFVKGVAAGNRKLDFALWDYMHDAFKVIAFSQRVARLDPKKVKNMDEAKYEIAQLANDQFGGQNWDVLMVSPEAQKWLRRNFLSSDWLVSTVRQGLAPLGAFTRGTTPQARRMRMMMGINFWIKALVIYWGGTQILNMFMRNYDVKENPDKYLEKDNMDFWDYTMRGNAPGEKFSLFWGRNDDGTERYLIPGKQFREVPEFFLHPIKKFTGKFAPLLHNLFATLTGKTASGWQIYAHDDPKMDKFKKTLEMWMMSFTPFSMQSALDEEREAHLSDIVFPSRKFSNYKAMEYYMQALKTRPVNEALIEETWGACVQNELDASGLYSTAIRNVEIEWSKALFEDAKTIKELDLKLKEYKTQLKQAGLEENERHKLTLEQKKTSERLLKMLRERANIQQGYSHLVEIVTSLEKFYAKYPDMAPSPEARKLELEPVMKRLKIMEENLKEINRLKKQEENE